MRVTKKIKEEQLAILEETYRGAKPELIFSNAFELLIAVILSAQCTDKRVNVTTARLFQKAATPEAILALGVEQLEEEIRDCGLFRNKAKNILAACQMLCEKFGGQVPDSFADLESLPGVGRKTANVVMSVAFHHPAIAVDTHVFRISNRLKLAVGTTPLEVEKELQRVIPREKWSDAHHWLIWHGRKICKARKPLCGTCPLADVCPSVMAE
ncbi:MAG: endonuclease III [Selenomonas sp.]|uniref:endonuclease III n=1 Tax=Selenomonas sp. TaxID=2053611 RepID=UPI0025E8E580|nr:endonuclease III [Selenomonas sp.]MCR5439303.1 endonuclease III [Selenomonas sp.]